MKIGIEGQRLFREKKHGMDMVALELIRELQLIDKKKRIRNFCKTRYRQKLPSRNRKLQNS